MFGKYIFTTSFVCFLFISSSSFAIKHFSQNDTIKKEKTWKVFGLIYGGFYHNILENNTLPKTAFEIKTGILGYKNQFAENASATIVMDVSKTTRDIKNQFDTAVITYTEGNNYTFYLKQAEIQWKIHPLAEISFGQILTSQYMLTQDKWWNHRYIYYTFQEINKYGPPADFGTRLKLNFHEKITFNLSAVNGEGPARWQDNNSKFAYSADLEFRSNDSLVFRIYGDYRASTLKNSESKQQSVFNCFAGYFFHNLKLAAEFSYIYHANFTNGAIMGSSAYIIYPFFKKFEAIFRYDFFQDIATAKYNHFSITGIQYEPTKNLLFSINYREFWATKTAQIYLNFGAKF